MVRQRSATTLPFHPNWRRRQKIQAGAWQADRRRRLSCNAVRTKRRGGPKNKQTHQPSFAPPFAVDALRKTFRHSRTLDGDGQEWLRTKGCTWCAQRSSSLSAFWWSENPRALSIHGPHADRKWSSSKLIAKDHDPTSVVYISPHCVVARRNPSWKKKSIQALKTGLVRFSLRRRIVALYLCDPDVPRPRCDVVGRREGQTDGRGVAAAAADVNVDWWQNHDEINLDVILSKLILLTVLSSVLSTDCWHSLSSVCLKREIICEKKKNIHVLMRALPNIWNKYI